MAIDYSIDFAGTQKRERERGGAECEGAERERESEDKTEHMWTHGSLTNRYIQKRYSVDSLAL